MSNFTPFSIAKSNARVRGKELGIPHHQALEEVARDSGFSCFHEMKAVAKNQGDDPRLLFAAFGTDNLQEVAEDFILDLNDQLEDQLSGAMAETNASGFFIDGYETHDAEYCTEQGMLSIGLSIEYSGEQDPDRAFHGSTFYLTGCLNLIFRQGVFQFPDEDFAFKIEEGERDVERWHRLDSEIERL